MGMDAFNSLHPLYRQVLTKRYGLLDGNAEKLIEVADELEMSVSTVLSIEVQALIQLAEIKMGVDKGRRNDLITDLYYQEYGH